MNNRTVRQLIFANDLKKSDVARQMGITTWYFSHLLQFEMNEKQNARTMKAIEELIATTTKGDNENDRRII